MSRTLRAGAGAALVAVLLLAGCQGEEPGPIPTATLPTPSTSAASPTPTPLSQEQAAANEAAAAYGQGREVAESLLTSGSEENVSEVLSPYFSGSYLEYWKAEVGEFRREDYETEGPVVARIMSASGYDHEKASITLFVCVDFRKTKTVDASGDAITRDFDYSYDEVVMLKDPDGRWKGNKSGSEFISNLQDSECSRVFE